MVKQNPDLKTRLLATFLVEANEHLQVLTTNLAVLDRGLPPAEARELLEATFRAMHTLKGAARSVSMMDIETVCHAAEALLSQITRGEQDLTRQVLDRLFETVNQVGRLLSGVGSRTTEAPRPEKLPQVPARSGSDTDGPSKLPMTRVTEPGDSTGPPPSQLDSIRVSTAKLDTLFLQIEDLLLSKLAAAERVRAAHELVEAVRRDRATAHRSPATAFRGGMTAAAQGVDAQARQMLTHLQSDQRTVAGAVDSLLQHMQQIRMMPVSAMLGAFPGMVRDLAAEKGKEVEWVTHGTDLEVDRKILDAIKDPLIHLVRNAIDHGIELPAARMQTGKPTRGRVALTVTLIDGGHIELRIEDDGQGIDLAKVREAAVRTRVLTPDAAQALTNDQALDLIYRSGLSTSPMITEVSGHGLGMAIVKERVERLDGHVHVESKLGIGTTVVLGLPASVATFHGLLVEASGQPFLLSSDAVERVFRLTPNATHTMEGHTAVRLDKTLVPLARLSQVLRLPEGDEQATDQDMRSCVILTQGEQRGAVVVDQILGHCEVLVKELRPPLSRPRSVVAAGLLGTGEVVLILRPSDLLTSLRYAHPLPVSRPASAPVKRPRTVLLVDDSITTRTMEKNLLEAAGYQVRVAIDGLDAWAVLKSETFDLVLSDIDMPRMDGFELTSQIRADHKLADLPVILVTARESREDKERGMEVGANAYVVKSSFDQSNLLEMIRRFQ